MKAKKKPIEKVTPSDLGVDTKPTLVMISVTDPPTRVGGGKVKDVNELIKKLKDVGVV